MAINLKTLSPSELESLIHTARSQLEQSRSRQVEEVRGKIEALLHGAGLTLGDVFPRIAAGRGRKAKSTVAPKYRNPEDPSQTWTGRGKRPLWLAALLKKRGVTLESLLIDAAEAPAKSAKRAAKSTKKRAPAKAARKTVKKAAKTTRRRR